MIRLILILAFLPSLCISQDFNLEELIDNFGEDSEISLYLDEIESLIASPILIDSNNVNKVDDLVFLNQFQIDIIKNLIRNNKFTKEYLLDTEGFREFEIELIMMCLKIKYKKSLYPKFHTLVKDRFKYNLMQTRGYEPNENKGTTKYQGSKTDAYLKIINTLSFENSLYKLGFIGDKDAGEKGLFPYYSAFMQYSDNTLDIIIGDYYLKRGSGLLLASGFAPRKGTEVIYPAYKNDYTHKIYTSTLEYRKLRGFSGIINIFDALYGLKLDADIFYSNQKRSGNKKEYENGDEYISSVHKSGYYRSDTELNKQNAYTETVAGAGLNLNSDYFSVGSAFLYIDNSLPIHSSSSSVFYGKHGMLKSVFANSEYLENLKLSSEYSLDANNNPAFILGAIFRTDYANLAFNARSYSKEFRSPYGNSFGEFSYPSNEEGIYFGMETKRYYNLKLSAYIDIFASKDSTYYVPAKVKGKEYLLSLEYAIASNNYLEILLKNEKKTDYGKIGEDKEKQFFDASKTKYRFQYKAEHNLGKNHIFRIKSGIEFAIFDIPQSNSKGFAYFIDSKYYSSFGLNLGFSYVNFDTDDYDSSIWFYEYSLPGYSNIMALHLKGYRISSFISYTLSAWTASLRFSYLEKPDEETIGSGWDETFSPIDRRLLFQIEYKL